MGSILPTKRGTFDLREDMCRPMIKYLHLPTQRTQRMSAFAAARGGKTAMPDYFEDLL